MIGLIPLTQKAPCENNFRAIENALRYSKACDISGIVACACARHGCFAPCSIVDLFRGEQQKNVDWSLLETIRTTNVDPDQGIMFIYDLICSYWVHLDDRIGHLLPSALRNAFTGLLLRSFLEQVLLQARFWNLYGPD